MSWFMLERKGRGYFGRDDESAASAGENIL